MMDPHRAILATQQLADAGWTVALVVNARSGAHCAVVLGTEPDVEELDRLRETCFRMGIAGALDVHPKQGLRFRLADMIEPLEDDPQFSSQLLS